MSYYIDTTFQRERPLNLAYLHYTVTAACKNDNHCFGEGGLGWHHVDFCNFLFLVIKWISLKSYAILWHIKVSFLFNVLGNCC